MIGIVFGVLDNPIHINCVLVSLKLTKLSAPQLEILSRSSFREEIVSTLDANRELTEGFLGYKVEECRVESSAYE